MTFDPVSATLEAIGLMEQLAQSWRSRGTEEVTRRQHQESEANADRRHAEAEANADIRQHAQLADAQRRHAEALTVQAATLDEVKRGLDRVIELDASHVSVALDHLDASRHQLEIQREQLTAFQNHSWAVFRQTPEGIVYRAWESAAVALMQLVALRDRATAVEAATEVQLRPLPSPPRMTASAPARPQPPAPAEVQEVRPEPSPAHFTKLKHPRLFYFTLLDEVAEIVFDHPWGCGLAWSLLISFFAVSSVVASNFDLPLLEWATVLPWWGWAAVVLGLTLLLVGALVALDEFSMQVLPDPLAFERARVEYQSHMAERAEQQRRAANATARYTHSLGTFREELENFEAAQIRHATALEEFQAALRQEEVLAQSIRDFDWMAKPAADRRYLRAIEQLVAVGRRAQPSPDELPKLYVPRVRRPESAPTERQRKLLLGFNTAAENSEASG